MTSAGVPDAVTIKRPTLVENNAFLVECNPLDQNAWRGKERWYRATITGFKEIKQNHCSFKFRDLSYSTGYTVSIVAFNGEYSGEAVEVQLQTSFPAGVLLRVLVLLGFSVPTLVVLLHLFDWWRTRGNKTATEECIGLNSASDAPSAREHLGPGASDEHQSSYVDITDQCSAAYHEPLKLDRTGHGGLHEDTYFLERSPAENRVILNQLCPTT
ncbi:receptor-type tyrosine-protein phosphatase C-like [Gadus chalcogrammus]|uniref:receptor-type tyrosine-protein phosphatase C-like n=1 Tax=Gadus chalcogrammus TaxID=1042646 RepID=UPI0024C4B4D7|nr:receptor-type tyrosine-protein phosphatase C-like [Gadus chalcogrammus]